jgi:hypothetical protein
VIELSPLTRQHVRTLFEAGDVSVAERLLASDCAENLDWPDPTPVSLERVRFAAIQLSDGSLAALREAIALAKLDWRDLLVAAGFADDIHAHERWRPREK